MARESDLFCVTNLTSELQRESQEEKQSCVPILFLLAINRKLSSLLLFGLEGPYVLNCREVSRL